MSRPALRKIRVGAGGIMLPNHAPLMVAEAFGTLAELHPGRIDLGLGRAPGTDQATMRALRRYIGGADSFPQDVQSNCSAGSIPPCPARPCRPSPDRART
jgi:alkanesulfonate monooxygenase SsuD/methylene tetrahydromethanopterin reductase-like flavin-dependent oxidoreductase (luciferase family)